MLKEIEHLIGNNYKDYTSLEFSKLICSFLKNGTITKEVKVNDRGDGRKGKVDLVYSSNGSTIGIELDRLSPRKKSIIKLNNLNVDHRCVITRNPVKIHLV